MSRPVGIEALGVHVPEGRQSSASIAELTGIPQQTLEQELGITSRSVPGSDDHLVAMAAMASKQALQQAGLTGEDLDCIIWAGEVFGERLWQIYGILLDKLIGCPERPWDFDINQKCGTVLVGMLLAKCLVQVRPDMKRILVGSGYRNCDLVDYGNPRSKPLVSMGASGVAVILQADSTRNEVLDVASVTDGDFATEIYIPAGGTENLITIEALEKRLHYLDVPDPEGMQKRLDQVNVKHFTEALDLALQRSGLTRSDIDYLALPHMRREAFEALASQAAVAPYEQCLYLDDIGHQGQNDSVISLERALGQGKVKDGDVVVLASAGIGWAWNAAVVRWGGAA